MVTSVFQINHVWISIKKYFYILLYAVPCSLVDFARSKAFWLLVERFLVLLGLLTPVQGPPLSVFLSVHVTLCSIQFCFWADPAQRRSPDSFLRLVRMP
jgi:hypothetical protein